MTFSEVGFKTYFFRFLVDFCSHLEAKWEPKLIQKSIKFDVEILMIFWWFGVALGIPRGLQNSEVGGRGVTPYIRLFERFVGL